MKPVVAAMAALTLATPVEAQERKSVAPKAVQAVAPGRIYQRIEQWLLTRTIEKNGKPLSTLQHEHSNSR